MKTSTADQSYLAVLIDGESEPGGLEAAMRAVERDPALLSRMERGLMVGQVIRGERVDLNVRGMRQRVSQALAQEPIPLRSRQRTPTARTFNRPAAVLALAASLATVAVLVGPRWLSGQRPGPESPKMAPALVEVSPLSETVSNATESVTGAAEPVNVEATEPAMIARWEMDAPADTTALDALLVDHRERASASSLTGFIPYAAVVGQHAGR